MVCSVILVYHHVYASEAYPFSTFSLISVSDNCCSHISDYQKKWFPFQILWMSRLYKKVYSLYKQEYILLYGKTSVARYIQPLHQSATFAIVINLNGTSNKQHILQWRSALFRYIRCHGHGALSVDGVVVWNALSTFTQLSKVCRAHIADRLSTFKPPCFGVSAAYVRLWLHFPSVFLFRKTH